LKYAGARKAGLVYNSTKAEKRKRDRESEDAPDLPESSDRVVDLSALMMERERNRVVEAYKALRKRRRAEEGNNFCTLD
jgi:hypothetical protein